MFGLAALVRRVTLERRQRLALLDTGLGRIWGYPRASEVNVLDAVEYAMNLRRVAVIEKAIPRQAQSEVPSEGSVP